MEFYVKLLGLVREFNWHEPSWSLFIIAFWLVVGAVYGLFLGRGRLLAVLVAVYIAKLLVSESPFLQNLANAQLLALGESFRALVSFGLVFLVVLFYLYKYGFATASEAKPANPLVSLPLAWLQLGLLINVVLGFIPAANLSVLHALIAFVFIGKTANFFWLLAPLLYLMIFGRFLGQRKS